MNNNFNNNFCLQTYTCSNYDTLSICSCDREVVVKPTQALLHQQSRFLIISEGNAKIKIQGRIYNIKAGDLVCILPYQYSEITNVSCPLVFKKIIFNFELFNELIKVHLNLFNEDIELINLFTKNNIVNCDKETFIEVNRIFDKLKLELGSESINVYKKHNYNFSAIYISSQVLELISIFERQASPNTSDVDKYVEHENFIIQYIYLNLSQKLTLKDLSKLFYMSESNISSYIYKMTGLYFSDLIFQMKIARVKNFLLYTNMDLEELSIILGYSDSSHISKVFANETNTNISEYRKVYKKINTICKIKESEISYKIVDYIYTNYNEDLNSKDVSNKFGINAIELNYHLKYLVEKNFECFLNYVRITKSVKLLLHTEDTISQIAYQVGYNSIRTFNRNFKKFYNTNPAKFRAQVQIQKK